MERCACGSTRSFAECCGVCLSEEKLPETPEALMRSRYTAYTKGDVDYIANTMIGPAAKRFDKNETAAFANQTKWLGLKVIEASEKDSQGSVTFIAKYERLGKQDAIFEVSEFRKENGKWFYYDGKTPRVGRNELCPCGSEKKFKKCCS